MSYAIVISAEAAAQMQSLAAPLPAFISSQLDRLRDNPTALSKPTTLLQAPGQLFEVRYNSGGVVLWISIIFRFGADEQTPHVEDIAVEFG